MHTMPCLVILVGLVSAGLLCAHVPSTLSERPRSVCGGPGGGGECCVGSLFRGVLTLRTASWGFRARCGAARATAAHPARPAGLLSRGPQAARAPAAAAAPAVRSAPWERCSAKPRPLSLRVTLPRAVRSGLVAAARVGGARRGPGAPCLGGERARSPVCSGAKFTAFTSPSMTFALIGALLAGLLYARLKPFSRGGRPIGGREGSRGFGEFCGPFFLFWKRSFRELQARERRRATALSRPRHPLCVAERQSFEPLPQSSLQMLHSPLRGAAGPQWRAAPRESRPACALPWRRARLKPGQLGVEGNGDILARPLPLRVVWM